jgi:hypothetical protein
VLTRQEDTAQARPAERRERTAATFFALPARGDPDGPRPDSGAAAGSVTGFAAAAAVGFAAAADLAEAVARFVAAAGFAEAVARFLAVAGLAAAADSAGVAAGSAAPTGFAVDHASSISNSTSSPLTSTSTS